MTPRWYLKPLAYLLAVGLIFWAGMATSTWWSSRRASRQVEQADQHRSRADERKGEAQAQDAKEAGLRGAVAKAQKKVEQVRGLGSTQRPSGQPHSSTGSGAAPLDDSAAVAPDVDLGKLVAAQDELIREQEALIQSLTSSRDAWRASAEEREREAVALRLALDAHKAAIRGSRWAGRLEGLAVGIAAAYLIER